MAIKPRDYNIEVKDFGPAIVIKDYAPGPGMSAGEISEYRDKLLTLFWGSSQASEMTGAGTSTLEYLRSIEVKFDESQKKVDHGVKALDELVDDQDKLSISGNINEGTISMRAALSEYTMTTIAHVIASSYRAAAQTKEKQIVKQLRIDYDKAASSYNEIGKREHFDWIIRDIAADNDLDGHVLIGFLHQIYPIQKKKRGTRISRRSSKRMIKDQLMANLRKGSEAPATKKPSSETGGIPLPEFPAVEITQEPVIEPVKEESLVDQSVYEIDEKNLEAGPAGEISEPADVIEQEQEPIVVEPVSYEQPIVVEQEPIIVEPAAHEQPIVVEPESRLEEIAKDDIIIEVPESERIPTPEELVPEESADDQSYEEQPEPVESAEQEPEEEKKKKPGRVRRAVKVIRKAVKVIALLGIMYGGVHIAYTHIPQTRGFLKPAAPIIEKVDSLVKRVADSII
jgi:hypothetical protein